MCIFITSRLSYNASLGMKSNRITIEIERSSVSPEGEPSDTESVSLLVINCTSMYNLKFQPHVEAQIQH